MLNFSKIIILRFKLNISISFNILTANAKYLYYVKVSIFEIFLEILFHKNILLWFNFFYKI